MLDFLRPTAHSNQMFVRQVALVARQLDPVVADLCDVLGLQVSFNDPGVAEFGLRNAVLPVGDTFLEVVSPLRADATAARFLERRGGDGGYMVIFQSDDLAAARARLATLGVRVVWEIAFPDIATIHLHPRDVGGAIVSLDRPEPPASWRWAGPGWEDKGRRSDARRIVGVELQADDPAALAERWAAVLGLRSEREAGATRRIPLARGALRFIAPEDARGPGVTSIRLEVRDAARIRDRARARGRLDAQGAVRIGGVRFELEQL